MLSVNLIRMKNVTGVGRPFQIVLVVVCLNSVDVVDFGESLRIWDKGFCHELMNTLDVFVEVERRIAVGVNPRFEDCSCLVVSYLSVC